MQSLITVAFIEFHLQFLVCFDFPLLFTSTSAFYFDAGVGASSYAGLARDLSTDPLFVVCDLV